MTAEPPRTPPQTEGAPRRDAPFVSWFGGITSFLNILGTLLILAMALAVNADVGGRNLFNHPIPGVLEFIGLSIVAVVFLQLANTLREGRHVSNDILMRIVAEARPRLASALYALFHLIGAILMALIVWFVWPILVSNYVGGYYQGTIGVVTIPTWPFIAVVIVGAAVTSVQFLILAWDLAKASMRPPDSSS